MKAQTKLVKRILYFSLLINEKYLQYNIKFYKIRNVRILIADIYNTYTGFEDVTEQIHSQK